MKFIYTFFITVFCSGGIQAYSNFYENPSIPYPPGCATLPDQQAMLYGDKAIKVAELEMKLSSAYGPKSKLPVYLDVYRVACADPGRSIIWLEFSSLSQDYFEYTVPEVAAFINGTEFHLLSLARMTNTWDFGTGTFGAIQRRVHSETRLGRTDRLPGRNTPNRHCVVHQPVHSIVGPPFR